MSQYKTLSPKDKKQARSLLNQLVDVVAEDISGSTTSKAYQVYVTGGIGPGCTSSIFQTVYDQDHTLQTSNPVLDIAYGVYSASYWVTASSTGEDTSGRALFPSTSLMINQKINVQRQFAQLLLNDSDARFTAPYAGSKKLDGTNLTDSDYIDDALFICFKRLFARDRIKKETFAMKFFQSASHDPSSGVKPGSEVAGDALHGNLNLTSLSGSKIYTDVGSTGYRNYAPDGTSVGNLVDASDTGRCVGIIFYEHGMCVLDMKKILSGTEHVSGTISGMKGGSFKDSDPGQTPIGDPLCSSANGEARFIPDLMYSGSIDDIVNHVRQCRFGSSTDTAITFQNVTEIHSSLIFCRATADEFNLSQNPTFLDSDGKVVVLDPGFEGQQKPFTFVTGICLYNPNNELMAVAKLSRPVEKNDEKDLTFRVRLDF
jgi:hypothetical protein